MDSSTSRRMHRLLEPVHAMIYFAPEAQEEYAAFGLDNRATGYFPARAAALGIVPWQVVQATFFGFSPFAVEIGMAGVWDLVSPADLIAARYRAADRALRRLCGDLCDDPGLKEAVELYRQATADLPFEGRPIYAAHAALPWPEEPHLAVWHGQTLAREFRGDGHLAALGALGIDAPQSLVLNGAYAGQAMTDFLKQSRAWSEEQWAAAAAQLRERGWLTADDQLTDTGREVREGIETKTDELSLPMWQRIGDDGCAQASARSQSSAASAATRRAASAQLIEHHSPSRLAHRNGASPFSRARARNNATIPSSSPMIIDATPSKRGSTPKSRSGTSCPRAAKCCSSMSGGRSSPRWTTWTPSPRPLPIRDVKDVVVRARDDQGRPEQRDSCKSEHPPASTDAYRCPAICWQA